MKALFPTDDGWPGLVLRLTLGLVMFPHGAQELLGHGCEGTMRAFTQKMGMPWVIRWPNPDRVVQRISMMPEIELTNNPRKS